MPGTLVIGAISDGTNSTSATNAIMGSAKAWVSFNGSNGAIRASYNISSVTRLTTGQYTVNMTNAVADTNYAICAGGHKGTLGVGDDMQGAPRTYVTNSSSFNLATVTAGGSTFTDFTSVFASVFR